MNWTWSDVIGLWAVIGLTLLISLILLGIGFVLSGWL